MVLGLSLATAIVLRIGQVPPYLSRGLAVALLLDLAIEVGLLWMALAP